MALISMHTTAHAFCGMYVSSSDEALLNEATQVVVLRKDTLTGITMQNDYKGPVQDFAMIVPVPEVIDPKHVSVIQPDQFNTLIDYTVPRLVEYDKIHKCVIPRARTMGGTSPSMPPMLDVKVEAEFSVSEYDLVVLSAKTSSDLLTWLERGKYNLPAGGEEVLQGYINAGMYFFVAKVDPDRLTFDREGKAVLTPLHFSYHAEDFTLPIRLGLLNSDGPQDLVVHVISDGGRVESANYTTGIMPTNLIVKDKVLKAFSSFYEALFTRSLAMQGASLMTEYANAFVNKCDPCTAGNMVLPVDLLVALGSEELKHEHLVPTMGARVEPKRLKERDVRILSADMRSQAKKCYEWWVVPNKRKGEFHIEVPVELVRDDLIKERWRVVPTDGLDGALEQDLGRCMAARPVKYSVSSRVTRIPVTVDFKVERKPDMRKIKPESYTITRLHGRFDRDSAGEDIVFRHASGLNGGFGSPSRDTDDMSRFYKVDDKRRKYSRSRFQARYIVLHSPKAKTVCKAKERALSYWSYDVKKGAARAARFYGQKATFTPEQIGDVIVNAAQAGLKL